MHGDILDDHRDLVELIEEAGWDVTDVELSVYESPWQDDDAPEASVTVSVRKAYPELADESVGGQSDGDDDNPFRVK